MRTFKVLRTQAFRFVAIYLALFAVSTTALIAFVYWNTALALDRETDETIRAEVTGLVEQYQRLGMPGLTDVVIRRSVRGGQGLYLLASPDRRVIVGNLDSWPQVAQTVEGFVEFTFERNIGGVPDLRNARGQIFVLAQGFLLLVARDVQERREPTELFSTTLPWSLAMMIVMGLAGGVLISRNFLARLDAITRTSRQIMAGDFAQRVPVRGSGDEFDDLSGHLNRMLDRIELLLRGIREVSDNVAHDLRSPLNRLRNRLELAATRAAPNLEIRRDIEAAVQETDRLIGTFNALLLIAQAESGSVRESMSDIDLAEIVGDVCDLYGPAAEEKGIGFSVHADGRGVSTHGVRNLISQALANLIDNAIKYTPKGGHISVTLEETEAAPAIVVADDGPGIPAEDFDRVTERFVRLESSRNLPGTGLGLSLVSAVAQLHGAELILKDNAPGLRAILQFQRTHAVSEPAGTVANRAEAAH